MLHADIFSAWNPQRLMNEQFLFAANHMFQYFITIVPTKLNTYKVSAETHQYSVTERVRLNIVFQFSVWSTVAAVYVLNPDFPAGTRYKPRCRQPRSLRDLHEI